MISDWIISFLLMAGSFFMLIAATGIIRFPDIYTRIHASTKAPTLGILLLLMAAVIHFNDWILSLKAIFIVFIIFLTSPLAAQMIGSAAHLLDSPKQDKEMRDDLRQATDNNN